MKIKKLLSLILAISILSCIFLMPTNATGAESYENIEIVIVNQNISEETKAKAIAFYTNDGEEQEGNTTYGLTCTLLGHKLETTVVYKITHEVRTTSPRCLKKTYNYDACTSCDYEKSTLTSSTYILCC